jgi:LruC domain-containing protein
LHSCEIKDYYDPNYKQELVSSRKYATDHEVELQFSYGTIPGVAATFQVYAENPLDENDKLREDVKSLSAGIHIEGETLSHKRVLPSYASELYLYSSSIFAHRLMRATVEDGKASFTLVLPDISEDDSEENAETRTIKNTTITSGSGWNQKKETLTQVTIDKWLLSQSDLDSKYDIKNPARYEPLPAEVMTNINNAFPSEKAVPANSTWFTDGIVEITGAPTELYMAPYASSGANKNLISYVVYEGTKDITTLTQAEIYALEVINILPFAVLNNDQYTTNGQGVTPGKAVQLLYHDKKTNQWVTKFPTGAKIVFLLIFQESTVNSSKFAYKFDQTTKIIWSVAAWNLKMPQPNADRTFTRNGKKTLYFSTRDNSGNDYHFIAMEDHVGTHRYADDDTNDIIFRIIPGEEESLTVEEEEFIPGGITRTTETYNGILGFEDNWPHKGDYDLNDVMLEYATEISYVLETEISAEPYVEKVTDTMTFLHNGATFNNGFAYKVSLPASAIQKLTISKGDEAATDYTVTTDGEGFIIQVLDDIQAILPPMKVAENTVSYTVTMELKEGAVSQEMLNESDWKVTDNGGTTKAYNLRKAPYNPYIMPTNPGFPLSNIEVHLPYYPPTENIDTRLFKQGSDVSQPELNWFYASPKVEFYPFAMHLSGITRDEFDIPEESIQIGDQYPDYLKWVNSDGTEYNDWYMKK